MIGTEEEIRSSERQLMAMELEERFQQNLAAFQAVLPQAWERFRDHQPARMVIGLVEGGINLVTPQGTPIYPADHEQLAVAQVQAFCRRPCFLTCTSRPVQVLQEEDVIHSRNSNRAIKKLLKTERQRPEQLPAEVNFLLHLGVGLGHGLTELMGRTDVRHLCIVEPEPDVFYASLMTFDWLELIERQTQSGHTLELIVGDGPTEWTAQMLDYVAEIGAFNLVQPYVFQHIRSAATDAAREVFLKEVMPRATINLGYFDDERVGLAHTLSNVEAGVRVLGSPRPQLAGVEMPPVFVVANGPSLDEAFEKIREYRDRAVVISCGTAFGSLAKAGIVPDIHLEIERDREISEWLSAATTAEAREQVQLVALNVVHPEVLSLFPNRTIALKANDLGARHLLTMEPEGPLVPQLEDCNPTVANFALTLVEQLGFQNVHLFGLDLGFPRGDLHHSKNSPHYLVKKSEEDSVEIFRPEDEGSVLRPGNFGGEIPTLDVFVNAAVAAERALARMSDRRIWNTADGIRIAGAQPLALEDMALSNAPFDTALFATRIVELRCIDERFEPATAWQLESMRRDVLSAVDLLIAEAEVAVTSVVQGMERLSAMHARLRESTRGRNGHVIEHLFRGSLAIFAYTMAQALHRVASGERCVELHAQCNVHFRRFLYDVREQVLGEFIAEDRRVRGVREKLAV